MYLNGGNGILSESGNDRMLYGDAVYGDGDIPYWYSYGWTRIEEPLSEPVLPHNGIPFEHESAQAFSPYRPLQERSPVQPFSYLKTQEAGKEQRTDILDQIGHRNQDRRLPEA